MSESTPGCLKGVIILLIIIIGALLIGGLVFFLGLGMQGVRVLSE